MTPKRRHGLALALVLLAAACATGGWFGFRAWQRSKPREIAAADSQLETCFTLSPAGGLVAVWGGEPLVEHADKPPTSTEAAWTVRLLSTDDGSLRGDLRDPDQLPVRGAAFSPSGRYLATFATPDHGPGYVHVWDVRAVSRVSTTLVGPVVHAGNFRSTRLRFDPSEERVYVSTRKGWQGVVLAADDVAPPLDPDEPLGVGTLAFRDDGTLVHAGLRDVSRVWPAKRVSQVAFSVGVSIADPALSDRGDLLVATRTDGDGALDVRRVPGGEVARTISLDGARVVSLAISSDSALVAACLDEGQRGRTPLTTIAVWDVETGERVVTLGGYARSLAFGPGRDLLVGAWGGKLFLWPIRRTATPDSPSQNR